jgi:uncharacterized repeat protein (TIGR02543 family)
MNTALRKGLTGLLAFLLAFSLAGASVASGIEPDVGTGTDAGSAPVDETGAVPPASKSVPAQPGKAPQGDLALLRKDLATDASDLSPLAVRRGTCGIGLTWVLDAAGKLTISGTGAMARYNDATKKAPWRAYAGSIRTLVVEEGVTSIEYAAFQGCTSLTSARISGTVSAIMNYAFYKCTGLRSVTLAYGVASIGYYAFSGCTRLASITLPRSVTSMASHVFQDCTALKSITIPGSVISMGDYLFYRCTSLVSVKVESGVRMIGNYVFSQCSRLRSVSLPGSVVSIRDHAFEFCTSLASLAIPQGVKTLGNYLFFKCSKLRSVSIPTSVTTIKDHAFYHCSSLVSVRIPKGVRTIEPFTFSSCTALRSVSIPTTVRSIGAEAFSHCLALTTFTVPSSVTSLGAGSFYRCHALKSITVPASVKAIGKNAFALCSYLTVKCNAKSKAHIYAVAAKIPVVLLGRTTYTVTFNANGGKLDKGAPTSIQRNKGTALGQVFNPTRTGYTFTGWYTSKASNATRALPETKVTRNITLYAHWK